MKFLVVVTPPSIYHFVNYDLHVDCRRDKVFSIKKLGMENTSPPDGKYDRARN